MSDFIDNDYTINFYKNSSKARTTLTAQITTTTQSVTEQFQVNKLDGFGYLQSTGSEPLDNLLIADENFTSFPFYISNSQAFGKSAFISGTVFAIGYQTDSVAETAESSKPGVIIAESGSNGIEFKEFLNVPISEMPRGFLSIGDVGNGDPFIDDHGKNWSYDRKNGRHVVIAHPATRGGYYTNDQLGGKVYVFTTSSSGFRLVQTITTASLPSSIKDHFGHTNANSSGQYYMNGYHHWAGTARVDGDLITIGTLVRNEVPESEFDYPDQNLNYSKTTADSPGVVAFRSSSVGFVFEKFLDGYDIQYEGVVNATYNLDGNVTHDLKDNLCVFGGNGGWGPGGWSGANGRIRIWRYNEEISDWVNEGAHDLWTLGFTGSMQEEIETDASVESVMVSLPHYQGGAGPLVGTRPKYAFYKFFGRRGLAVSENKIVVSATQREFGYYATNPDIEKTYVHRVFILNSGSNGWELEADFNSPNVLSSGSTSAGAHNDFFGGGGVAIHKGTVVVKAPFYRTNNSKTGRAYVYKSSSDSGWGLDTTLENPFLNNTVNPLGSTGTGWDDFARGLGSLAGFYYSQTMPAIGGTDDEQFIIIPQGASRNLDYPAVSGIETYSQGGIYALQGTASFTQTTEERTTTQETKTTNYVTSSGGPVPFRFSTKYYRAELEPN